MVLMTGLLCQHASVMCLPPAFHLTLLFCCLQEYRDEEVSVRAAGGRMAANGTATGPNNALASRLLLAYMASYERMGRARAECVANCTCEPSTIDASWQEKASLMQMHFMEVKDEA